MTDATFRLCFTFGFWMLLFGLEWLRPARQSHLTSLRMVRHFSLGLSGALLCRLVLVGGLTSVAAWAESAEIGIFNTVGLYSSGGLTGLAVLIICFLLLDFSVWAQHVLTHKLPFLWRFHRVHHSDIAMDVTTALRFHPGEILFSLAYKSAIILALGAPPIVALAFEVTLGAGALFTHANVKIPTRLDDVLRLLVVTPAMHLIHHSQDPRNTHSNYGFSFSIWDRLFRTYRPPPDSSAPLELIGLEHWREAPDQSLRALLVNPLQ
ncbi:sterol desaturase family protein [Candidatus Phycosocius spiralis]|uniref:Fatty acid hydroxylase n=1 Tax=Candidatus Phycosocius spiralis TaxID=2815099 RepID=A0ABQ4PXP2_9PROT|nr:sterol desaturase family protein [Candidatus Phycosocius spiralis]GIU67729.1 fatty acid hydroxylase [Candidatus Phycosocius spiralis]